MPTMCKTYLKFDGKDFPDNDNTRIPCVQTTASVKLGVPIVYLELIDNAGWLDANNVLADGTKITLVIKTEDGTQRTTHWRLNSFRMTRTSSNTNYLIDGYLYAATKYWMDTATTPYEGTSSTVLSQLASDLGLTFDGVSTNDNQIWIPASKPYWEFCRSIARAGYASDSSCMQIALDQNANLFYYDISNPNKVADVCFLEQMPGCDVSVSHLPTSSAGSNNYSHGYNQVSVRQSNADVDALKLDVNIKVTSKDGSPNVNASVKNSLSGTKVVYQPLDSGNLHENYSRAVYQNERTSTLMSTGLDILLDRPSKRLGLLRTVNYKVSDGVPKAESYKGLYTIATKVIRVVNNEYYEKYEMYRNTLQPSTNKPTAALSVASAASVLTTALKPPVSTSSSYMGFDLTKLTSLLQSIPGADSIVAAATQASNAVKAGLTAAQDALSSTLTSLSNSVQDQAVGASDAAMDAALAEYNATAGTTPIPDPVTGELPPSPRAVLEAALASAQATAVTTATNLVNAANDIVTETSAMLKSSGEISNKISQLTSNLGGMFASIEQSVTEYTSEVVARMSGTKSLDSMLDEAVTTVKQVATEATTQAASAVNQVIEQSTQAISEAANAASEAASNISNTANHTAAKAQDILNSIG